MPPRRLVTPPPWHTTVRRRLRAIRQARGLSFEAVRERVDVPRSSLVNIESGTSDNLYLDQVHALLAVYEVPLFFVLFGEPTEEVPAPGAYPNPSLQELDMHLRRRIREDRGTRGTPSVAVAAGMVPSTLVRWESGEYRRIDLIRLERIASALGRPLREWFVLGAVSSMQQ